MIKRVTGVLFFATVIAGLCAAQSMFRNFHQEGPASHDVNTQEMTLSHPSLPLGTQIRITNPRNGKQISAKVTGRIPATEGRIADLSKGAAEALELSPQTRNPVVLEVVNERPPVPEAVPLELAEEFEPPPEPEEPVLAAEEPPPEPEEPVLAAEEPPPEPEEPPPEPEEPVLAAEEPPPEPEEPVLAAEEPLPEPEEPLLAAEEPPLLPPHEDPGKEEPVKVELVKVEPAPEAPPVPETEFVPGPDPQAPSLSSTDSKNQTTAPVAAQSPNITIYNVLQSPNSFATDSAPVNAGGNGTGTGADGTQQPGSVPIIAAAPSSKVSTSDRRSNSNSDNSGSNNTTPAAENPESKKPAVATATAQIVAPVQSPPPQAGQRPAQVQQAPPQPAQPWQQIQPQRVEPAPLPPIVDQGTAVIRPYMPGAGDRGKVYRVQAGSYKNTWHAREAFDRLTTVGFRPSYEAYGEYIRVVISGVPAMDMPSVARLLGRVGFTEALIREEY